MARLYFLPARAFQVLAQQVGGFGAVAATDGLQDAQMFTGLPRPDGRGASDGAVFHQFAQLVDAAHGLQHEAVA